MKPLTIEQLKALPDGDWVWVEDFTKSVNKSVYDCGEYCHKVPPYLDGFCYGWQGSGGFHRYEEYGTKWLAYKNKEQAEAEGDGYEDRYCALKAAIVEVCDKLNNKQYNDEFYRLTLGGKIQRIETIAEAKLKKLKGEQHENKS